MSSNPIQQPRLHLYKRTGRFLELDLKIPELYCSRLEVGNKRRIRFDSSTTLAVAGAVTASLAFFFFGSLFFFVSSSQV